MESDSVPKTASSPAPEIDLLPKYTIPGILHFIQHEWTRFEMDRAHWEVERAELQVESCCIYFVSNVLEMCPFLACNS